MTFGPYGPNVVRMVQTPEPVDLRIAQNLLREMRNASVGLESLAQKTGISQDVLSSRIARGSFKVKELAAIAVVLELDLTDLVRDEAA